jgi:hypothetical protein
MVAESGAFNILITDKAKENRDHEFDIQETALSHYNLSINPNSRRLWIFQSISF